MKKLKHSDVNAYELLLKANLTPGFSTKLEFINETEAKKFFDKMKREIGLLPDFLKPNTEVNNMVIADMVNFGVGITQTTGTDIKYVDPMSLQELEDLYNATHDDSFTEVLSVEEFNKRYPYLKDMIK